jgi:hypothetical protein
MGDDATNIYRNHLHHQPDNTDIIKTRGQIYNSSLLASTSREVGLRDIPSSFSPMENSKIAYRVFYGTDWFLVLGTGNEQ